MRSALRKLSRLLRLAAVASAIVAIVKLIRGRKSPPVTGEASWPPIQPDAPAPGSQSRPSAAATDTTTPQPMVATEPEPESSAADSDGADWVEPVDGVCPVSHPVKGNAQSKIYHVPGGASYDRTIPERCFRSAEAAEADGFRAAKR